MKEQYIIFLKMKIYKKPIKLVIKINNKIKIPNNVLYIQIDAAFEPMWENKKGVENKIFLSIMRVGVDE